MRFETAQIRPSPNIFNLFWKVQLVFFYMYSDIHFGIMHEHKIITNTDSNTYFFNVICNKLFQNNTSIFLSYLRIVVRIFFSIMRTILFHRLLNLFYWQIRNYVLYPKQVLGESIMRYLIFYHKYRFKNIVN